MILSDRFFSHWQQDFPAVSVFTGRDFPAVSVVTGRDFPAVSALTGCGNCSCLLGFSGLNFSGMGM
jgi:hypothetical protein